MRAVLLQLAADLAKRGEPFVLAMHLFGPSPTARALSQLGKSMGYSVDVVAPGADRDA
jgi:hypothetical protein